MEVAQLCFKMAAPLLFYTYLEENYIKKHFLMKNSAIATIAIQIILVMRVKI